MLAFEKSKNLVVLFGGQRSVSSDPMDSSAAVSFGDTWEWDTTTGIWTARTTASGPTDRFDGSLVWDTGRKKAILFGGMQKESAGVAGVPKQDTWEWDPETAAWTERTLAGDKPSPRWGQAAAFDGTRARLVVFGGWDINSSLYMNDLWDWDPTTGTWKQRFTGSEPNLPSGRVYASLVSNDSTGKLELVAGSTMGSSSGTGGTGGYYGTTDPYGTGYPGYAMGTPSREVWELEPAAPAFTKRPDPLNSPGRRTQHAMAYCPDTGRTYVFGGLDDRYVIHDDLWEWDGSKWALVAMDSRPAARADAGLAYDPVRKSLILYGGDDSYSSYFRTFSDTWEWSPTTRKWTVLSPTTSPNHSYGHRMVTDAGRGKILLFGGIPGMSDVPYKDPMMSDVWEWDGAKVTWTNRTSVGSSQAPGNQMYAVVTYDEARQKLLVFPSATNYGGPVPDNSTFWEWDPYSTGWSLVDPGDNLNPYSLALAAYDTQRRRTVLVTDAINPVSATANAYETRELDSSGPTWYVRYPKTPPALRSNASMAFDSKRGVVVMFGGMNNFNGFAVDETWEYSVSGLGKGSGCSTAFASSCVSGNCVDGVCCESASCTGPCQSCNVSGKAGTCVAAAAGTEVPGSCSAGQACDGSGVCKTKNGTACTSDSACASGHCVDGVCCNSDCKGTCLSCNQTGRAGLCSPYVAGADPEGECTKGGGPCGSSCNGAGACAFPSFGSTCGDCMICDGNGTCMTSYYDPSCLRPPLGGTGGSSYTTRSSYGGSSGSAGYSSRSSYGGTAGYVSSGGSLGGTSLSGGIRTSSGGSSVGGRAGSGGSTPYGGFAGTTSYGGTTTSSRSSSVSSSSAGSFAGSISSGGSSSVSSGSRGGSTPIGGSAGTVSSSSSSGSSPRDGGAGSSGNRDAGRDLARTDAGNSTRLGNAGCSCSLGEPSSPAPLALPLTVMFGLLLRWRRRR
jgi:MYXO-CTERM domain-containing protein